MELYFQLLFGTHSFSYFVACIAKREKNKKSAHPDLRVYSNAVSG
jgi:hypothetical protein